MHFVNDYSENAQTIAEKLEKVFEALFKEISAGSEETFATEQQLSLNDELRDSLFRIVEGTVTIAVGGRAIAFLSEGDFFGFPSERVASDWQLHTDFAVKVQRYSLKELMLSLSTNTTLSSIWSEIQALQCGLYLTLFAEQCNNETAIYPSLRFFDEGTVIIKEGDDAQEVFTLVEGVANVTLNGSTVGTLGEDEIFGAIAALTETKRTATVIAKDRCTVAVLPVGSFKNLIRSKPMTTEKLISDLAKKIIQLNARIAGASE